MAIAERIRFLVDVDAAGAQAGFQAIAGGMTAVEAKSKDAQKQASSLIKFGGAALLVAGALGAGLLSASSAASDLQESLNFAQREFGESTKIVDDFAKHAAKSAGLSEAAALQAASGYAALGKAAGVSGDDLAKFSVRMTQLAADLASLRNTSLEDATSALTSALRGRYVAISKYGVVINDAILKQEAFNEGTYDGTGKLDAQARILATYNILLRETGAAQGDFERTSGNLANQQRILAANFENLKAGIGQGVMPVLNGLIGVANTAVGAFNGLSDGAKSAIGGFGTWAALAVGAVGAISLMAGALIKLKANLTNATGGLNGFGQAAKYAGLAIAAFGAVETAFEVLNNIHDMAGKSEYALRGFAVASQSTGKTVTQAFLDIVKTEDDTLRLSHLWEDFGKEIHIVGTEGTRDIEDINRAFEKLLKQSPKQAQDLVDSIREQADALDHSSGQYKDNIKLADDWQKKIDLVTSSNAVMGDEAQAATDAIAAEGEATKEADNAFKDAKKSLDLLTVGQQAAEEGAKAFAESLDSIKTDDVLASTADLRTTLDEFFATAKKAKPVLDQNQVLFGKMTEDQIASTSALGKLGNEYSSYLEQLVESGASQDKVYETAVKLRVGFYEQGHQIGLTNDQMNSYLDTLGLTPEQVSTAIKLRDDEIAKKKVELYIGLLDDIDPEIKTQIAADIAEGDYQTAANRLDQLARDRNANINVTLVPKNAAETRAWLGSIGVNPNASMSNITVNVPPTLNPGRVVGAIRTSQARSGALARG